MYAPTVYIFPLSPGHDGKEVLCGDPDDAAVDAPDVPEIEAREPVPDTVEGPLTLPLMPETLLLLTLPLRPDDLLPLALEPEGRLPVMLTLPLPERTPEPLVLSCKLPLDDDEGMGGRIWMTASVKLSASGPDGPRLDLSQQVVVWPGKVFSALPFTPAIHCV